MGDEETRRPSRFAIALGAIATAGLAVRVAAVAGWYRHLELGPTDNYFYWAQARAVARGDGFINPFEAGNVASATHPPLYSTYLSIFARVGLDTPTQFRLASCLLGMATVVVIGITARRIAGARAGLISAGIAALFPPLWIADGTLVSESIYALVIALVLLAGHSMATRRDARAAALLGLTIGLAALARSEGLALVVLLAWPLAALAYGIPWRRRVALAGVATAVALLTISPWVIRNLVQFDETVVMSDSTGYVLALGNCDQTYSGAYLGYWHFDCTFVPGPGVSRTRGDLQAREQATRYMREHKTRLPVVAAARVGRLWHLYRVDQGIDFDVFYERRERIASTMAVPALYVAAALALVGVWARRRDPSSLVLFASVVVSATAAAALAFGVTRYRIAGDVGVVLFAGIGADWLLTRVRRRSADGPAT